MPKKILWEEVKRAYLMSGKSLAAIALEFGVSQRSIERYSAEQDWAKSREQATASKPSPKPRPQRSQAELDQMTVIESAIADLSAGIADADTPIKSKEAAATALIRLLEYREKLQPPTAADLAERAIALGINPDAFLEALREAWSQQ